MLREITKRNKQEFLDLTWFNPFFWHEITFLKKCNHTETIPNPGNCFKLLIENQTKNAENKCRHVPKGCVHNAFMRTAKKKDSLAKNKTKAGIEPSSSTTINGVFLIRVKIAGSPGRLEPSNEIWKISFYSKSKRIWRADEHNNTIMPSLFE